jgi:hypothetical protein
MRVFSGFLLLLLASFTNVFSQQKKSLILKPELMKANINYFNSLDSEDVKNYVSNADSYNWLSDNIPLFDCPDSAIQKIYYYRWWTFRKHLKLTPNGYIFTEFITKMNHGGKYNAISSALGHHIYEGRWLHNPEYVEKYIDFWLYEDKMEKKPHLHAFSGWLENSVYNLYLVNHDASFIKQNLDSLEADYKLWEQEKQLPDKMFWQFDVRDAMEESISGGRKEKNVRPTINSYMYGNADALAKMYALTGNSTMEKQYQQKATELKKLVQQNLWNEQASFFEVKKPDAKFADAREELGYIPWYFNLPDDKSKYAKAWEQLTNPTGFNAPWGITTAERRHPLFRTHGSGHGCEWDGAVWPFATTQTLKGLANLLTVYKNKDGMTTQVFYNEFEKYAHSFVMKGQTYIGEYQDEKNGEWLKGDNPRSRFYNHSGFADLVINDLVGLKPRADQILEIYPLIPQKQWDWFCLDNVFYHGKSITILWDKSGSKYHKGKGMHIYADGKEISQSAALKHVLVKLPG